MHRVTRLMRQPRPKPTWLDWLSVAMFVLFLVAFAMMFAALGSAPGPNGR
jgi:ABC-type phosphate/phosphonate transport system permease subunit